MGKHLRYLLIFVCLTGVSKVTHAQLDDFSAALDSARDAEDLKEDSIIYNARYVRYATLEMMKRATFTFQIDTTHKNFQYYNPQLMPRNPSIHLGSYGLATRDLLYTPDKTIGVQAGFHALDRFLYLSDSVKYYRARAPFSELYNVGFFFGDQLLQARIAQNINQHLNIGAEFHATRANGFYPNQQYNDLKGVVFSWYESPSHRYNLLTNFVFNRLISSENGSVLNDTLFRTPDRQPPERELVRLNGQQLNRPRHTWRDHSLFARQSYFLGRIDTLHKGEPEQQILPTNRVSHELRVRSRDFQFFKNEPDANDAFPVGTSTLTTDTTLLRTVSNEFKYSFFLRGKSTSIIKNEVKLDLGYLHEMHWYEDSTYSDFFQNNTLKAGVGYRFSDRVNVTGDFNQIVQGTNFGDYLYDANVDILMGEQVGRIILGAYTQNKSPELVFQRVDYTYHEWQANFDKTKTTNLSFSYANPKLGFKGRAEYFLISNHLFFREVANEDMNEQLFRVIEPAQFTTNINLLKITVEQNFKFNKLHLDNFAVYQQSDFNDILAIPQLYTWHSFYYNDQLYQIVDFSLGLDVRFNTPFQTPSYAINVGQFYNDNAAISFSTYPIVDVWATATVKRMNLFVSYNFLNQLAGYPEGFYSVRRYPMYNANLRMGVSWKFYD